MKNPLLMMLSVLIACACGSAQASLPLPEVRGIASVSPFQNGFQLYVLGAAAQEIWKNLGVPSVRDGFSGYDVKSANRIRCMRSVNGSNASCWIRLDSLGIDN